MSSAPGAREYYLRIGPRILPWLTGRRVLVRGASGTLGPAGAQGTAELERPAGIDTLEDLEPVVEAGARAFFAQPASLGGTHLAVIELEGRGVPLEGVRLVALKAALVLRDAEVDAIASYDGSGRIRFIWRYAFTDPGDLPWGYGEMARRVATRLLERTERRLAGTPERDRVGLWSGYEGTVTAGGPRGTAVPPDRVAVRAVPPDGWMRVPFSLHEETGLAAVPLSRRDLYRFDPERSAAPGRAMRLRTEYEAPMNFPQAVIEALDLFEMTA